MMTILGAMALTMGVAIIVVLIAIAIKWLSGDFEKRRKLKIGQRVAVRLFSLDNNCDEFKTGKIVATRPRVEGAYWELLYAVMFDDGKIRFFREDEIFTGWREK